MICSSGIGFDPVVDGKRLTFGFEGIWQGTALLYDHQTRSLWMHLTGTCVDGTYKGTVLDRIPTGRHTFWMSWTKDHPDTTVLKPDPRWIDKPADQGYFDARSARSGSAYLPPTFGPTIQTRDERLELHDLLYGIVVGDQARGYPFRRLKNAKVAEETVADVPVTIWWQSHSQSAAGFDRRLDGVTYSFTMDDQGRIHDTKTKSRWSMEGRAIDGPLFGKQLKALRGLQSEWYGWYANHPKTTLWSQY